MRGLLDRSSVCFAGGVAGGLVAGFGAWLAGRYGWTDALGVSLAPSFDSAWIYARLIWCGVWGLLFLPPILDDSVLWRGLFFSLCPSLAQLFFASGGETGAAGWGVGPGTWAPVVVFALNVLWGWTTAAWVVAVTGDGQSSPYGSRLR